MSVPLIGVTTSEVRIKERVHPVPQGEPRDKEMALGLRYLRGIEAAGGLPVVLPPLKLDAVEPLLDKVDGVCLSGGPDLDPAAYSRRRHPQLGPVWPELDLFELAVARRADARGMPILAVCRGAQALNVARGGTLFQHLPDRFGDAVQHRQREPGEVVTHAVEVESDTQLADLLGQTRVEVNSFHHQAVAGLGRSLRAVAWASDGVVEGLEATDRDFAVGVQWHAECLTDRAEHAALFEALVEAALPGSGRAGRSAAA
jgi:putative glutamine amidotransferase